MTVHKTPFAQLIDTQREVIELQQEVINEQQKTIEVMMQMHDEWEARVVLLLRELKEQEIH